jgi:hypothetical protein
LVDYVEVTGVRIFFKKIFYVSLRKGRMFIYNKRTPLLANVPH